MVKADILKNRYFTALPKLLIGLSFILAHQLPIALSLSEDYYGPEYEAFEAMPEVSDFLEFPGYNDYMQHSGEAPAIPLSFYKRHLGSLAALSGVKEPVKELKQGSSRNYLNQKQRYFTPIKKDDQHGRSNSIPSNRHDEDKNFKHEDNSIISTKNKRFLGTLARGGWFPRHFRGVVNDGLRSQYEKRHIGAAARQGWMPFSARKTFSLDLNPKRNQLDYLHRRVTPYQMLWSGRTKVSSRG